MALILDALCQLSPKDSAWDGKRSRAQLLYPILSETSINANTLERLDRCTRFLGFRPDEQGDLKLKHGNFCHVRLCPVCSWRRSRRWLAMFTSKLPKIKEDYPSCRFLFLSLTLKNCPVNELRETLDLMSAAWQRMLKRKVVSTVVKGYIRRLEITRQLDGSDFCHPHYHCILMVNSGYFTKNYIKQKDWIQLWKEALRIDYDPSVNIQAVKPNLNKIKGSTVENAQAREIYHSLLELIKYNIKDSCLIWNYKPDNEEMRRRNVEWLDELWHQLQGIRFLSTGGVIRQYVSEDEMQQLTDEDLIHYAQETGIEVNEYQADEEAGTLDQILWFSWHDRVSRYRLHQQQEVS